MKVIDLLNKIANNEEVPTKIKYGDYIYYLSKYHEDYVSDLSKNVIDTNTYFIKELVDMNNLNDEIEIIEEKPKKIEELDFVRIDDYTISGLVKSLNELFIEYNEKINEIIKTQNDLIERIEFDD